MQRPWWRLFISSPEERQYGLDNPAKPVRSCRNGPSDRKARLAGETREFTKRPFGGGIRGAVAVPGYLFCSSGRLDSRFFRGPTSKDCRCVGAACPDFLPSADSRAL